MTIMHDREQIRDVCNAKDGALNNLFAAMKDAAKLVNLGLERSASVNDVARLLRGVFAIGAVSIAP